MIRLAVVGIGGYGEWLAQSIVAVGPQAGCTLVAGADPRLADLPEQAAFVRCQGGELFADALTMFDALKGRCDGVYIATGIQTHEALTVAALRAGLHVHIEKPPAATVQEVDRMIAAVAESGRLCMVGTQGLHSLDIRAIKQRLVSGAMGNVQSATCHVLWPRYAAYYGRNNWAGRLRDGDAWVLDGPATNANFHQVANSLILAATHEGLAEPMAVRAELYAAGPVESHNLLAMQIRTNQGSLVQIIVSHCTQDTVNPTITVAASRGRANWKSTDGGTIAYQGGREETFPRDADASKHMVANMVQAIRTGDASTNYSPLSELRKAVVAIDGAHESSRRVHRIGDQYIRMVGDGPAARTVVDGLDEIILECTSKMCLPSDLPAPPPWSVPTQWYDLSGYNRFPAVFSMD